MGAITTALLLATLAQAQPGSGSFSFEGVAAQAQTASPRAFIGIGPNAGVDQFENARGHAVLSVHDRIDAAAATYGDRASFNAVIRVGLDEYDLELVTVGAAPLHRDSSGSLVETGTQNPFPFPIAGGVALATVAFGGTGVGLLPGPPAMSGISLFGTARVTRNGIVVDEQAPIEVLALATGVHADDDTHRLLPGARAEDTELIVYLPRIQSDLVPNRFLFVVFEDVALNVAGREVPQVASVPSEVSAIGVPTVLALQGLPTVTPPNFRGFSQDLATRDNVPIGASPTPSTPQPLTGQPATPLPAPVALPNTATPITGGPSVTVAQPAPPLISPVQPLTATPASPLTTTGPTVQPGNASPATPLLPGVTPLNSQGALTGPGTPTAGGVSPTGVGGTGTAGAPVTP